MRSIFRALTVGLALSAATAAMAQSSATSQGLVALTASEPLTLDQFADALRAATGRTVLIGLTPDHDYLRQDRNHRLKFTYQGALAPLLNGVAPRYGIQWEQVGEAILLYDNVSARPTPPAPKKVAKPADTAPSISAVTAAAPAALTDLAAQAGARGKAINFVSRSVVQGEDSARIGAVTTVDPDPSFSAAFSPAEDQRSVHHLADNRPYAVAPTPRPAQAHPTAQPYYADPQQAAWQSNGYAQPSPPQGYNYAMPMPQQGYVYGQQLPPQVNGYALQMAPHDYGYAHPNYAAGTRAPVQQSRTRMATRSSPPSRGPAPAVNGDASGDGSLAAIRNANLQSTQAPTSAGFVNSTIFYDYMPGAIYQLHTSPRFISTIALRPGEKLISKAAGDTVRWVMGETRQGDDGTAQTLVFVKPIKGDLRTNIVITTNERTYIIEAISHTSDTYTSVLSWNYPREQFAEMMAAQAAAQAATPDEDMDGLSVENLHFNYKVKARGRGKPEWMPVTVFDDGAKTYIQFSPSLSAGEAPPLFALGENGRAELVNYRMVGQYYVVDRLMDAAELRLGEQKQQIVRITRSARGA